MAVTCLTQNGERMSANAEKPHLYKEIMFETMFETMFGTNMFYYIKRPGITNP